MLLSTAMTVRAYSTGAPAAACARIYPEGHNGTSLSLSSSPFVLDISQLYNQLGNFYYTPGYNYTRKLLSLSEEMISRIKKISMRTVSVFLCFESL